jgi:tetratricopeptide (TPR) repeat protein
MAIAETWIQEGKWTQAVPVLEETARQWPTSEEAPVARMRVAQSLAEEGHYEQAVGMLELVERDYAAFPQKDELNLAAAECLMKLKQYGAARVRLMTVFEQSSNAERAERAAYALGDSLLAEGKSVAALEVYRGALRRFPEGTLLREAPVRQARAYLQMGLYSEAERALKRAPDAPPPAGIRPVLLALAEQSLQDGKAEHTLALMADPRWPHDQDAEPEVLLLNARAIMGSGLIGPALEKSTLAATLAKDEETRTEAFGLVGDCCRLMNEPVRAAMAYGGKTE